jgi:hypothetical protein
LRLCGRYSDRIEFYLRTLRSLRLILRSSLVAASPRWALEKAQTVCALAKSHSIRSGCLRVAVPGYAEQRRSRRAVRLKQAAGLSLQHGNEIDRVHIGLYSVGQVKGLLGGEKSR